MTSKIILIDNFRRKAKPLLKKYASLAGELENLGDKLLLNPRSGTIIGENLYKIRLAVKSKGKGKSGGMRIISYVVEIEIIVAENPEQDFTIFLLTIYDKSERDNISDKEIIELLKDIDTTEK